MQPKRHYRWITLCALVSMAIMLPIASHRAAPQQSAKPMLVSLGDVSINKVPYIIAQEEGLYKKYGIDVALKITPGAAGVAADSFVQVPASTVMREDEVPEMMAAGCTPTIVSQTSNVKSLDRIILATTDHWVRWWIFARPEITRPEQIKGKRLGVSGHGAMSDFCARLFAQRMGWNPDQDLSIMLGAKAVKPLKAGQVDAIVADEVAWAAALEAGYKPLVDMAGWKVPIGGSGIVTTKTWLKQPGNRDRALKFIKAVVEAISLLKRDEKYTQVALEKWYGIKDRTFQHRLYLSGKDSMEAKPYPCVDGLKKTMELYNYHEMRQQKVEDFYDDSFIKELDKTGFIDKLYKPAR